MPCEDYPCCGHEWGDCEGQKYGSDEDIKQAVYDRMMRDDYDPDIDYGGPSYDSRWEEGRD
jgi:hypothetical protein